MQSYSKIYSPSALLMGFFYCSMYNMKDYNQNFWLLCSFLLLIMFEGTDFFAQSQLHLIDIDAGIKAGLQHEYDQAFTIFTNLAEESPNDPVGPFFAAAVMQSKMMDYETNKWQGEFNNNIDLTIALSK